MINHSPDPISLSTGPIKRWLTGVGAVSLYRARCFLSSSEPVSMLATRSNRARPNFAGVEHCARQPKRLVEDDLNPVPASLFAVSPRGLTSRTGRSGVFSVFSLADSLPKSIPVNRGFNRG